MCQKILWFIFPVTSFFSHIRDKVEVDDNNTEDLHADRRYEPYKLIINRFSLSYDFIVALPLIEKINSFMLLLFHIIHIISERILHKIYCIWLHTLLLIIYHVYCICYIWSGNIYIISDHWTYIIYHIWSYIIYIISDHILWLFTLSASPE